VTPLFVVGSAIYAFFGKDSAYRWLRPNSSSLIQRSASASASSIEAQHEGPVPTMKNILSNTEKPWETPPGWAQLPFMDQRPAP
jgi:hypothetical protein